VYLISCVLIRDRLVLGKEEERKEGRKGGRLERKKERK
jgi:hypothetical protein